MNYLLLVIGFLLLIKGADWLVDAASKLAKTFGVPSLIIGLSVVAFGTSAPEATIGVFSAFKHANQITLGDVVGSSIANIALIIGISAILLPLSVDKSLIVKEVPMSFGVQVLFLVLIIIGFKISRFDSLIFLFMFALFIYYIWKTASKTIDNNINDNKNEITENEPEDKSQTMLYRLKLISILLVGLVCLVFGGSLVIDNSISIAHSLGISEAMIGVTIVAIGTSLPELVTCVVAAIKKESDIAIGNIIGSNIFNILFVLGLSALINPIAFKADNYMDVAAMLLSTILLYILMVLQKRITRLGGIILLSFYLLFIISKVFP